MSEEYSKNYELIDENTAWDGCEVVPKDDLPYNVIPESAEDFIKRQRAKGIDPMAGLLEQPAPESNVEQALTANCNAREKSPREKELRDQLGKLAIQRTSAENEMDRCDDANDPHGRDNARQDIDDIDRRMAAIKKEIDRLNNADNSEKGSNGQN